MLKVFLSHAKSRIHEMRYPKIVLDPKREVRSTPPRKSNVMDQGIQGIRDADDDVGGRGRHTTNLEM